MWLTFDLDGVLIENPFMSGVFPEIAETIARRFNHTVDCMMPKDQLHQEVFARIKKEYQRRFSSDNPHTAYDWDEIVNQVAQDFSYPDKIDVEELVIKYCKPPHIKAYDRADDLLKKLKEVGWKIGVITNGYRRYQQPVLEALDLMKYVDQLITPQGVETIKPDPSIFDEIEGLKTDKWFHIGDTISHDILGGNIGGAKTILVYREMVGQLRDIPVSKRVKSDPGQDLIDQILGEEAKRYSHLCQNREECRPDYIIGNLDEILEIV